MVGELAKIAGREPIAEYLHGIAMPLIGLVVVLLWAASSLSAQTLVRLQVDNDAMVLGPRHDRDYTHGIDFSVGRRRCTAGECRVLRLGVIQALFTPDLLYPLDPPADRPFAGYLGAHGSLEHWTDRGTWQLTATLGARGPAALGEPMQRFIHRLFGFIEPPSWDRQLGPAPWIAASGSFGRWVQAGPVRLGALGRAETGTMRTLAEVGARAGVGPDARWLDPRPVQGFHAGIAIEAGQRWFASDATLMGVAGGAGVSGVHEWRPWIGGDASLRFGSWAATVSMRWLGRDFDGQESAPVVGSAVVQWTPR